MSKKSNDPITLAEVLELPPGTKDDQTWINGILTVGVIEVRQMPGKPNNWIGKVCDPDNANIECELTIFGRRAFPFEGQVVEMDGSLALDEYKGKPKILGFSKTSIRKIGQLAPGAKPAAGGAPAASGASVGVVAGETVGNATTCACNLIATAIRANPATPDGTPFDWLAWYETPEFSRVLYTLESDIIRVGRLVKEGKLAPSAKARATGSDPEEEARLAAEKKAKEQAEAARKREEEEAARKAKRPKPGEDGAVDTSDVDEDDVPF